MKTLKLKECTQILGGVSERRCARLWRRWERANGAEDPDGHPNNRANRIMDSIIRLGC